MADTKKESKKVISEAAESIAQAVIEKKFKLYKEVKDLLEPKDMNAVTMVLRSGCKIRIRPDGETFRPDHASKGNLENGSAEQQFFYSLRFNKALAKAVREKLWEHAVEPKPTPSAAKASEFAEML